MRTAEPITRAKIDELLHFLPGFERPFREFIMRWEGGYPEPGGAVTTPYPVYPADVNLFFHCVSQPCWCDFDYTHKRADVMLGDDALISRAGLDEIRTILTFCARGEKQCDGFWGGVLRRGRVQALLRRLERIRDDV